MGDSHAALFGQNCFERGMAKATYGTGSSVMMNIGRNILQSNNGLVTSIAWGMDDSIEYVFEGNINCTGATIKWLVEDLELIPNSKISGQIAASIDSNEGVYLVPAFVGLSAPYWDSDAKASITGITRGTKKAHIVRAAEESIAYQIRDILDLMVKESGVKLKELRVDGGPTRDNFLMQFQANILNVTVVRNKIEELSAIGSAFMAGLAIGFWNSKEEIKALRAPDVIFNCKMDNRERNKLYKGWKEAVRRTLFNY
jgi:glycerol kinase